MLLDLGRESRPGSFGDGDSVEDDRVFESRGHVARSAGDL